VPDEIDDPHSGQRVVFRRVEPDVLEVDLYVRPGGYVRDHVHPSQEETFEVVAGTFVLNVGGEQRTLPAGADETIPRLTKHGFPAAANEVQLRVTVRPALDLAGYFRDYLSLSRDGRLRIPMSGLPKPLLLFAMLMHRYDHEIAAPGLPLWLQRLLWRVLAWLGRVFGQKL
jgi:quercetin dioxygenase-like cupin family protein